MYLHTQQTSGKLYTTHTTFRRLDVHAFADQQRPPKYFATNLDSQCTVTYAYIQCPGTVILQNTYTKIKMNITKVHTV